MTEPGWHPDPQDPRVLRWWDGSGWTDDVRPAPPGALPPQSGNRGLTTALVIALVCVLAVPLLAVVAIIAIRFLGTSAEYKFSSVGSEIGLGRDARHEPAGEPVVVTLRAGAPSAAVRPAA